MAFGHTVMTDPYFFASLGYINWNREVGRQAMPFGIGGVVRESTQRKRIFVQIAGLGD